MLLSETGSKVFYKKFYEWIQLQDLRPEMGISDFTKKFKDERTLEFGPEKNLARLEDMEQNGNDITFIWTTPVGSRDPKKVNDNHEIVDNPEREYILKIKFIDFVQKTNNLRIEDLEDFHSIAMSCNIQIDDNDPSFQFQGMNYNISQLDGSLNPTNIPPKDWRRFHNNDNFLSKFMQGLIDSIEFFYKPMMLMFNDYNSYASSIAAGEEININDDVYDNPYNIDGFPGEVEFTPEYNTDAEEKDINEDPEDDRFNIDWDSLDIDDSDFEVTIEDDDRGWVLDINNPESEEIEYSDFSSDTEDLEPVIEPLLKDDESSDDVEDKAEKEDMEFDFDDFYDEFDTGLYAKDEEVDYVDKTDDIENITDDSIVLDDDAEFDIDDIFNAFS